MTKKNRILIKQNPVYYVSPRPGGAWQVKQEGIRETIKAFLTQKEAIQFAHDLMKQTGGKVDIHRRKGKSSDLPKSASEFWLGSSQTSLDTLWDNDEDDVYAQLLKA